MKKKILFEDAGGKVDNYEEKIEQVALRELLEESSRLFLIYESVLDDIISIHINGYKLYNILIKLNDDNEKYINLNKFQ